MKYFFILFSLLLTSFVIGQNQTTDIIYFKDGSILQGEIISQQIEENITVKNENGVENTYEWDTILKYTFKGKFVYTEIAKSKETKKSAYFEKQKNEYGAFGIGVGSSYGAIGFQYQIRTGKTLGAGMHFGVGYVPKLTAKSQATIAFKVGAKFYYYKPLFIDIAFGTVAVTQYGNPYLGVSMLVGGDFI
ncbi:MAG: hypothetical protein KAH25_03155, partial [Bacteroidales bacterium]|nr:hypothetical protein [Bacteroidales bacterium]